MTSETPQQQAAVSKDGSQHVTDEVFNTCSHMAAAIFALLGFGYLVVQASVAAKVWHIVGFSIYGVTLFLLFMSSTLHHGMHAGARLESKLRILDYQAIYLLIAGSLTPICLTILRGALGWTVFGAAWLVAIAGVVLKATHPHLPKAITNTLYVTMGWLALALAPPLYRACGPGCLVLLAIGGGLYTIGSAIFLLERPNPLPGRFGFHEIWHLFVVGGAGAHYLLVLLYVLPSE